MRIHSRPRHFVHGQRWSVIVLQHLFANVVKLNYRNQRKFKFGGGAPNEKANSYRLGRKETGELSGHLLRVGFCASETEWGKFSAGKNDS